MTRSASATSARLAGQGSTRFHGGVEIGSEDALECAQILVGGP